MIVNTICCLYYEISLMNQIDSIDWDHILFDIRCSKFFINHEDNDWEIYRLEENLNLVWTDWSIYFRESIWTRLRFKSNRLKSDRTIYFWKIRESDFTDWGNLLSWKFSARGNNLNRPIYFRSDSSEKIKIEIWLIPIWSNDKFWQNLIA
jgi:hypothetical protein